MTTEALNYFRATASSSSRSSVASTSTTSSHTPPLPSTPNGVYNYNMPPAPAGQRNAPSATISVVTRGTILFLLGSLCALVLNILQMEYKSNLFPSNVLIFLSTTWWVLPLCGLAAVYIGFMYPAIDRRFGQLILKDDSEWSLNIKCFSLFIGLNHLCAKITFSNSSHFLVILISLCILFWYWFDKTKRGLFFNVANALAVILSTFSLRHVGIFSYSQIQFDYLLICLFGLMFSGGITFGNIGRLLDHQFEAEENEPNAAEQQHLHND